MNVLRNAHTEVVGIPPTLIPPYQSRLSLFSFGLLCCRAKGPQAERILRLSPAVCCIFVADITAGCGLFAADFPLFRRCYPLFSAAVFQRKANHFRRLIFSTNFLAGWSAESHRRLSFRDRQRRGPEPMNTGLWNTDSGLAAAPRPGMTTLNFDRLRYDSAKERAGAP